MKRNELWNLLLFLSLSLLFSYCFLICFLFQSSVIHFHSARLLFVFKSLSISYYFSFHIISLLFGDVFRILWRNKSIICEPSSCNVETLTMERFLLSSNACIFLNLKLFFIWAWKRLSINHYSRSFMCLTACNRWS